LPDSTLAGGKIQAAPPPARHVHHVSRRRRRAFVIFSPWRQRVLALALALLVANGIAAYRFSVFIEGMDSGRLSLQSNRRD